MAGNGARISWRNFYLGLANGSLTTVGASLAAPDTVVAAFVVTLMGGNVLWVGLLVSLFGTAGAIPQMLLASRLETTARRMPYYWLSAALRSAAYLVMALLLLCAGHLPAPVQFAAVTGLLLVWAVGMGIGAIPFWSVLSDSIPPSLRGRYFGLRQLLGGLMTLGAGFWVKQVLSPGSGWAFPANYGVLFLAAAALMFAGTLAFCLNEEYPHPVQRRAMPLGTQMRRGPRLVRRDPNYRRLLRATLFYGVALSFTVPFIVPFGIKRGVLTAGDVGVLMIARQLSYSLFAFLWGRISERRGNRLLLVISGALGAGVPLLMLGALALPAGVTVSLGGLQVQVALLYLAGVFVLLGATAGSIEMGQGPYLLEMAPGRMRSTYLGFFSVTSLVLAWAPLLGALLIGAADRFVLGFSLALVAGAIAVYNLARMAEVREEAETVGPSAD